MIKMQIEGIEEELGWLLVGIDGEEAAEDHWSGFLISGQCLFCSSI